MVLQAFVDDSGTKGTNQHFVLAGLIGSAEAWAEFSDEWRFALGQTPAIQYFKMSEAAGRPSGQFFRMTEGQRDEKLRMLARIINRHPRISTYSIIDLDAHAKTWALSQKPPHSDPYFWPYQNTIMAVCFTLWELGWRERFEIMFDNDVIFGPRAKRWYPFIKRLMEIKHPEEAAIMPIDPMFQDDHEFVPLQAADLFAWCARDNCDRNATDSFEWLFKEEFTNVRGTVYSQYYDLERMTAVKQEAERLAREGNLPGELVELYAVEAAYKERG